MGDYGPAYQKQDRGRPLATQCCRGGRRTRSLLLASRLELPNDHGGRKAVDAHWNLRVQRKLFIKEAYRRSAQICVTIIKVG